MTLGMNGLALAIYWLGAALVEQHRADRFAQRASRCSANVLVFSTYATYVVMSFMMLVMIFMLLSAGAGLGGAYQRGARAQGEYHARAA